MKANTTYISLGSNLSPQEDNMLKAISAIREIASITNISKLYTTKPLIWPGKEHLPHSNYLNAVTRCRTDLSPQDLMKKLLLIETSLGRIRTPDTRWEPRSIDLDVIFYNDIVLDSELIKLPHPSMHQRDFVLQPLCDISPSDTHPVLMKSFSQILSDLKEERFIIGEEIWTKALQLID